MNRIDVTVQENVGQDSARQNPVLQLAAPVLMAMLILCGYNAHASNHGWTAKVSAGVSPVMSTLTIGAFPDAENDFDNQYDAPAFPTTTDVNAYFEHPEWGQAESQFLYDIRKTARLQVWDFTLVYAAKFKLQDAMVSWDISHANLPATMQLTLTDLATDTVIDMREAAEYFFNTGWITTPQTRYFRITAENLQPPELIITTPADGTVFTEPNITVSGTASDGGFGDNGIQSVTINGLAANNGVTSGNDTTNWFLNMVLASGENILTVVATDNSPYNDATVKTVTVSYYPPSDSDNDGLPDEWEMQKFGSLSVANGNTDSDGDGLSDRDEYLRGTNPNSADTDGDGINDSDEIRYGSNPTVSTDTPSDHRPNTPVIRAIDGEVSLDKYVFDAEGYSSPDLARGDYLTASQWEISLANEFAAGNYVVQKIIEKKAAAASNAVEHRRLTVTYGTLKKATNYWIRTRHRGFTGLYSDWSNPVVFTTVSTDPFDLDGDGNDDRYQVAGVDTNGNGTDDQAEGIRTLLDASKTRTVGLAASSGTIRNLTVMAKAGLPTDQVPADQLPFEFFSFRIDGLPIDTLNPAMVTVTFYFPETLGPVMKWYKYDPITERVLDYTSNVEFGSKFAVVTLVDGGIGDADGVINGIIVDPSGPGLPAASSSGSSVSVSPTTTSSSAGGGAVHPAVLLALLPWLLGIRRRTRSR